MKHLPLAFVAAALAVSCGGAIADTSAERDIKLSGDAMLYGGDIGDPIGPSAKDAKVFFNITGKAAQRMYELMGSAGQMTGGDCDDPDVTSRTNGDVACMRDKSGYACYIGFDLVRGKSIVSSIC